LPPPKSKITPALTQPRATLFPEGFGHLRGRIGVAPCSGYGWPPLLPPTKGSPPQGHSFLSQHVSPFFGLKIFFFQNKLIASVCISFSERLNCALFSFFVRRELFLLSCPTHFFVTHVTPPFLLEAGCRFAGEYIYVSFTS